MDTRAPRKVNNSIYETYGDRWYTAYDDPIALLRAESKAKLPWVLERIRAHGGRAGSGYHLLDVGCGAGFLSNALAQEGIAVEGLDLSPESLATARRHDATQSVHYQSADAYELPFANGVFDAVTAMDFLEHVEDPARVISEIARVLKPGGLFFFHTFNRNWLAHLVIIKFVEWFVKNTPRDMHVIHLFLKPAEVEAFCRASGLSVGEIIGIRPSLRSIPLRNLISGVVPENLRFKLVKSTKLSYLGCAVKT
jgi:2-polyprenyl-6-hydroxyphenyl methylase/3-demethylubiquinone-9 3-methyltransferase